MTRQASKSRPPGMTLDREGRALAALCDLSGMPRPAHPLGALVLIASGLGASAADTAEAMGVSVAVVHGLVHGPCVAVTEVEVAALAAWVRVCGLVAASSGEAMVGPRVRAELAVGAWEGLGGGRG